VGQPQLSPDGRWVLFVKDGQVHRAAVDPGNLDAATIDAQPPFFVTLGVNSDPVWSPDSRKVAFVSARYDQRQYFPTQGQVPTHSLIAVYDIASRTVTYLAPSVDRDTSPTWSADGRQIAFIRRPGLPFGHFATARLQSIGRDQVPAGFLTAKLEGGYNTSFMVADGVTGEAKEVWHNAPTDDVFARVNGIEWVGDRFVFQTTENSWPKWYSLAAAGGAAQPTLLTPADAAIEHTALSPDGKWLYWSSNQGDPDGRHLWRAALAGGPPQQITRGPMVETALAIPGSGTSFAALQAGPKQPVTVAVFAAAGGAGKLIGTPPPAEFPAAKHVVPTSIELTAADGVKSRAILFLPPDLKPGERRPALVYNHGNGGRLVLGYADQSDGYYHLNYALINYLVNRGYIVAASNYRGDGALYSKAYNERKNYGAEGVTENRDVIAAGLYLKSRPDVDADRLGVWGLSYGGWLTGEALSRNSDVFKAGAIFAGVQMRSTSFDPQNLAYQSSPAFNIDKWTSPTMFLHGDDDRNVEFSQTVGAVQALRAHGTPVKAVVFPDETHYYFKWQHMVTAFHAVDDWFDQQLIKRNTKATTQSEQR
jgi:dipeptidyl aminopeptidase/acylaminoacyl peptidase